MVDRWYEFLEITNVDKRIPATMCAGIFALRLKRYVGSLRDHNPPHPSGGLDLLGFGEVKPAQPVPGDNQFAVIVNPVRTEVVAVLAVFTQCLPLFIIGDEGEGYLVALASQPKPASRSPAVADERQRWHRFGGEGYRLADEHHRAGVA